MNNPMTDAIAAVRSHIKTHSTLSQEQQAEDKALREKLSKMKKEDLIDEIVRLTLKRKVTVNQGNLLRDILKDPACAILTYEDIQEVIKANLETDQKFSVDNIRWYKSKLATQGEPVLNRMTAKERNAAMYKYTVASETDAVANDK